MKRRDCPFFENPTQDPEGEEEGQKLPINSENTMSEKDTRKTEIDAATNTLAELLRKPLLSLLVGAEPGEHDSEIDRWWTLDGVSNIPAEKLQEISECFSTLAKLRSTP